MNFLDDILKKYLTVRIANEASMLEDTRSLLSIGRAKERVLYESQGMPLDKAEQRDNEMMVLGDLTISDSSRPCPTQPAPAQVQATPPTTVQAPKIVNNEIVDRVAHVAQVAAPAVVQAGLKGAPLLATLIGTGGAGLALPFLFSALQGNPPPVTLPPPPPMVEKSSPPPATPEGRYKLRASEE